MRFRVPERSHAVTVRAMTLPAVLSCGLSELAAVEELASRYGQRFGAIPGAGPKCEAAFARWEAQGCLSGGRELWGLGAASAWRGFFGLKPGAEESASFGRPIYALAPALLPADLGAEEARALERHLQGSLPENAVTIARIPAVADTRMMSLQQAGFRVTDTRMVFANLADRFDRESAPLLGREEAVRKARSADAEGAAHLAGEAFSRYPSHWAALQGVGGAQLGAYYARWAHRDFAGAADAILVLERRARIVGFISWRYLCGPWRACGRVIAGAGLSAVSHGAAGGYVTLLGRACREAAAAGSDLIEVDTHSSNVAVQRVCQALDLRPTKVEHTLHWQRHRATSNG
jgi:hypothetical protein